MIWSNSENFDWKFDAPNHSEKLFLSNSDWRKQYELYEQYIEWADFQDTFLNDT